MCCSQEEGGWCVPAPALAEAEAEAISVFPGIRSYG